MGVKLSDIITKRHITFDELRGKKIAIDFSNAAYQFLSSIRQPDGTLLMDNNNRITSHLMGILNRFSNLIEKDIKIVIIFDGKPPILKVKEQEDREHKKRIAEKKFVVAKEKEDIEGMQKYAKQTSRLTIDMINESKQLIKSLGLPIIQAPSEADAQISFMCEKGDVDYAASSDYDCLLYNAPRLITNLTVSQRRKIGSAYIKTNPELILLEENLERLGINRDQLLAIAILVGTDYHEGVKRIGPKTALKLVKQYNDFNELFKHVGANFNWKQIYAVFKNMPIIKEYRLRWEEIDDDMVKKILVEEHDFNKERVEKVLERIHKRDKGQAGLSRWV